MATPIFVRPAKRAQEKHLGIRRKLDLAPQTLPRQNTIGSDIVIMPPAMTADIAAVRMVVG